MQQLKKNVIQGVKVLSLALVLGLGIGILEAAWTPAPGTPPSGNPDAPINVGSSPQEKLGGVAFNTGGAPIGLVVATGNVGIGILDPAAKLEVGGNIRITGGNPLAGKALVATDNLGNATWQQVGFSNMQTWTAAGTYSWTTPAGVSKVMVEVWGGGAGGTFFGQASDGRTGGPSGAYTKAIMNIPSQLTCTIVVGAGGQTPIPENPPLPAPSDGGASSVTCGFASATAGGGSWSGARGDPWTAAAGTGSATGVVASYVVNGRLAHAHDGAAAPNGGGGGRSGIFNYLIMNCPTFPSAPGNCSVTGQRYSVVPGAGGIPGGGGGGGNEANAGASGGPNVGGRGRAVVYW